MKIPSLSISRRKIIGTAGLTALASTICKDTFGDDHQKTDKVALQKDNKILFQGDSITDAGRNKKNQIPNAQKAFGGGYAWMAASHLLISNPEFNLTIHNRGISGNKVHQLAARWDKDCIALQPDILSILIGVNDIWHGLNGRYDGTVKTYENDFIALLERTRKSLPNTRFIICEPFVLKCGAVNDKWFPEFDHYRESARKISERFEGIFVPFQSMFDQAVKYAPAKHWAGDGVHPSSHGASLMAHFWLKAIQS